MRGHTENATLARRGMETHDKEGLKGILRLSVSAVKLLPECRRFVDVSIQEQVERDEDVLAIRHAELRSRQQEVTTIRNRHCQQHDCGNEVQYVGNRLHTEHHRTQAWLYLYWG